MSDDNWTSLKGHFLIAMPGLNDPNFAGTVVCMCEHTAEGSFGLVINRILPNLTGKNLLDELKIQAVPQAEAAPIHYGGPVHLNEIFILHGPPLDWEGSLQVTPSLAMSNTRDVLEAIAAGIGPERYQLTLGCSGWGPAQLESEVKENVWLSCPISEEIIFDLPADDRWREAVKQLGIDPALLTDTAGHA